jgi:hypothetical protein
VTVGHLIIVFLDIAPQVKNASAPTATVSDGSNTYTQAVLATTKTSSGGSPWSWEVVYCWYSVATTGGTLTVTCTPSLSTAYLTMSIAEYSAGSGVTISQDGSTSNTNYLGTNSSSCTAGAFTPTAGDLIVMGADIDSSSNTYTAGSGFTLGYQATSSAGEPWCDEYDTSASGSAINPTITLGTADQWLAVAAAFKAVGGASSYASPPGSSVLRPHSLIWSRAQVGSYCD